MQALPDVTGPGVRPRVQVAVLGPVEVHRDGRLLDLGGPRPRALVAALATSPGRPAAVDSLVGLVWGEDPPPGVMTTLQSYVSGLRKVLEPGRPPRSAATVLVTVPPGYALHLDPGALDTARFADLVTGANRGLHGPLLGPPPPRSTLEEAARGLEEALGLWRGTPYADLGDAQDVSAERARWEELRLLALEARATASLGLGEHRSQVVELEQLTRSHPLRERLWALRVLALARSGRQGEAVAVLSEVRAMLADELGLDPGAELQDLQARLLAQDTELDWRAPTGPAPAGDARPALTVTTSDPLEQHETGPDEAGPAWPMLGRADERGRLVAALDRAVAGQSGFAVLTGEPGIGKSRLSAELVDAARARGVRVVLGRCSQDEGAPPLYPWDAVFEALGLERDQAQGEGAEFAAWQGVVATIAAAAEREPLVLVLDDLHWADTATLRVLRLLVEAARAVPLLVLVTWRDKPAPTGALADVAEAMARAHAERLELTGLDAADVAGVVGAVTGREPTRAEATALRDRTEGNPFFLVEYSRLAGRGQHLAELLAETHPPTAVQEVISRRLERLPAETHRVLAAASVAGRQVGLAVLAECTTHDEDELFEILDPAVASGLVREAGVDAFAFDHALVRDTLYSSLSPSRRARQHARVAQALERRAGTETEAARHWLAAGDQHAATAWRAAIAAGHVAMHAHAHPEAAALFGQALEALERDPAATPRDRYDVLVQRALADRWAARWDQLTRTAQEAVEIADALGEVTLAAEAAILTLRGGMWQSARHGEVHAPLVGALRRSLAALPAEDSALRCRCLVVLAGEIYYASGIEERRALVDESVAMARRLGDDALLLDVLLASYNAVWVPGTEDERLAVAEEGESLARRLADPHAEVVAGVQAAVTLAELGRMEEFWVAYGETLALAERLRLTYALLVLQSMALPWRAMAGDFPEGRRLLAEAVRLVEVSELPQGQDAIGGNVACLAMWDADFSLPDDLVVGLSTSTMPTRSTLAFALWRNGEEERAREWFEAGVVDLSPRDWYSKLNWGCTAAMAAFTGAPDLGACAYDLLAPFAGHSCSAGSGVASGPVDAFLALGAMATGERELASRHADDALRVAEAWQIPLFTEWFGEQRDRHGF